MTIHDDVFKDVLLSADIICVFKRVHVRCESHKYRSFLFYDFSFKSPPFLLPVVSVQKERKKRVRAFLVHGLLLPNLG